MLTIEHDGMTYRVRLPLVGAFQVENALVAAGQAIAGGGEPAAVFAALEGLIGAKGRLELVGRKAGAPIFVDYAHKPDALAKALDALRPYVDHRLVVVFGAGGDRDAGKRPLMGAIAAEKADRVIVTDDNPRSEDPAAIRAAILRGAPGAGEIGDRDEAIRRAVADLRTRRRAADRRQGPRDRPDHRREDGAVQRSRGGRGTRLRPRRGQVHDGAAVDGRRHGGGDAAPSAPGRCRPPSPAFPSTAAPIEGRRGLLRHQGRYP